MLVQEAMKILVNVLGYDVMAQENGGYPRGYIAAAARLQISHGMNRSGEEPALRDDILCMRISLLMLNCCRSSIQTRMSHPIR